MSSKKKKKKKKSWNKAGCSGLTDPDTRRAPKEKASTIDAQTLALIEVCGCGGRGCTLGRELLEGRKQIEEVTRLLKSGANVDGVDETRTCPLWR
eukprot:COSAG04_NODE_12540_length_647_cov_5.211679_1_plen_94_part_10